MGGFISEDPSEDWIALVTEIERNPGVLGTRDTVKHVDDCFVIPTTLAFTVYSSTEWMNKTMHFSLSKETGSAEKTTCTERGFSITS